MTDQIAPDITVQRDTPKAIDLELLTQLEELFSEVQALALRLRQESRRNQSNENASSAGRNLLGLLSRFGPLTVPQIARLNLTSRQNIQTIVNRMRREEWVELAPNQAHKTSELIRLTDRGLAALELVSRDSERYKEKIVSQLSKEGLTRASAVLRSIRKALVTTLPPDTDTSNRGSRKSLGSRKASHEGPLTPALSPSNGETDNLPESRSEDTVREDSGERSIDSESRQPYPIPPQEDGLPISLL